MNRWIAALLACLWLMACTCALADAATLNDMLPESVCDDDIIGTWRMTMMNIDGMNIRPELIGIEMRIEFREDHTVQGLFEGIIGDKGQAEEPWTLDASQYLVLVSGQPYLKVRCEDGVLCLLMDEEISEEAAGDMLFLRVED